MVARSRPAKPVASKRMTARERSGAESATKRAAPGRRRSAATAPQSARRPSGRYTAPIPRSVKRSPVWFPWAILSLLLIGVLCIILDYIQVLPASPTNWYVVGGLVAILAGALLATSYR